MDIKFTTEGWEDYLYWQTNSKATLKKVNTLIKDIQRTPFSGIGKPEPLKFNMSGLWSRRITSEHRLVYTVLDNTLVILQCRYHY
jgi:toxin-antitoxin system, toxin component, Txe/YoeB family